MHSYESLKNKAYKIALQFNITEFKEDVIYAKLEKQGIPSDLAKEVATNIALEKSKPKKEDLLDVKKLVLLLMTLGIIASITVFVITGSFLNAVGLLIFGLLSSILVHSMTRNE